MIDMRNNPQRFKLRETRNELRVHQLRGKYWSSCTEAYEDIRPGLADTVQKGEKSTAFRGKRITAGNEYLPDGRSSAQVGAYTVLFCGINKALNTGGKTPAETVPAVPKTFPGDKGQHPVGVLVHQMRSNEIALFSERIGRFFGLYCFFSG